MKLWITIVALLAVSAPAFAQLGGIGRRAQQVQERKQQFDDLNITEEEEIKLGADVSLKIRTRFGVVQDAAVHKYVTLVGTMLTEQTTRPKLPWTFIVLDTDGVNAFAAPGGFVHITRGALALIKSEAELAGVLGHEIAHVAQKHTVNAIRKSKGVQIGTSRGVVESRRVPRGAREPRVRHGARELVRSRRRAGRRQRRHHPRAEGRVCGHRAVGISRRGSLSATRVRRRRTACSRRIPKRRSASARSSSSRGRSRAPSSQPVTRRRSSISPLT